MDELAKIVLQAKLTGKEVARRIRFPPPVVPPPPEVPRLPEEVFVDILNELKDLKGKLIQKTIVEMLPSTAVTTSKDLIDKKGEGVLKEIYLNTNSSTYKLAIERDRTSLYYEDWSWFNDKSRYVDHIVARQDGSNYILKIADTRYEERIRVTLTGTLTINSMIARIDIIKEE